MGRITITDIARHAGVSTGAVSYALNDRPGVSEKTRQRILSVAQELGWEPSQAARALMGAGAEAIGLILARSPETLRFESFYMQFVAGIEQELAPRSFALMFQVVPDLDAEIRAHRRWKAARRVDGIIVVDPREDDPRSDLFSGPNALPSVVVGHPDLAHGATAVWTDDAAAMRESVRYLAELGHRRIGRVTGTASYGHTRLRDRAFSDEVERIGGSAVIIEADFTPEQGGAATRRLLDVADPVTAIIYDNDVMALAGLSAAAEAGYRVPDDLSIIAWDDSPLCEAALPKLTAFGYDVVAYGAHVARRLMDRIGGAPAESFVDGVPRLTLRGSTAAPPAR